MSDVDDDEAAGLAYGVTLGLCCIPSAGVEEPNGLGVGDVLGSGTAEGDGGSRTDMPSLCSDVTVGIYMHCE